VAQPVAPYGSWPSPIRAEDAVRGSVVLAEVWLDGADVLWVEGRPAEAGRRILVRRTPEGVVSDVTPPGFNVRSRVHEYGGGSLCVADGTVVFSHFEDGRLYIQRSDGSDAPRAITPERSWRYADLRMDAARGRLLAVREDHSAGGEAVNTIVAVALDGVGVPRIVVDGHDFFAAPRVSPDGRQLAWLAWDHPNMPWDGTTLWVAEIGADGSVSSAQKVAGGPGAWIAQPRWAPDGTLWFVGEPGDWMNLQHWRGSAVETVGPIAVEFAPPDWVFDRPTYAVLDDGRVCAVGRAGGRDLLWVVDPADGSAVELTMPFTEMSFVVARGPEVSFVGARPGDATALARMDVASGRFEELRRASDETVDAAFLSEPEPIEFPTAGGSTAHALYYRPRNPKAQAPAGERPPLVVRTHGGPTAAASTGLNLAIQYLTSRGIALVDVDYGGSTGYGRAYRRRLEGEWGLVDVDDCVAAAQYLVERGDADPARLCIEGGSAGGYTTLAALAFRDVFAAGICYFGIGDLEVFTKDTHKFESRYMDRLVGPYPAAAATYRERSPVHFVDRLSSPLLILQGLDDRVVPPNQSQMMADALRANRVSYAYLAFEGEGHGFRGEYALRRSLEAELSFLGQVFGFSPAEDFEPLELVRPAVV
jgi:dipeptidyl aminopeptidase/acylaminoacyl peptidase